MDLGRSRFWLDMGVDGFREDVITYISKAKGLPNDHLFPIYKGMPKYNHGPHIHEYLEEFKRDALEGYDYFTVAEAPLVWPKRALKYTDGKKGQIDTMIQFQCQCADCLFTDYIPTKFHLRKMKRAFSSWQTKLAGKAWRIMTIPESFPATAARNSGKKAARLSPPHTCSSRVLPSSIRGRKSAC